MKFLGQSFDPMEVAFLRGSLALLVVTPLAILFPAVRAIRLPKLYLLRCALGLLSVVALAASFSFLPLAVAMALFQVRTLAFAALGMALWGEPSRASVWAALVVGTAGVVLLIEPRTEGVQAWGVAAALAAALASAGSQTALKAITRTESPLSVAFWFSAFVAVMLLPFNLNTAPRLDGQGLAVAAVMALLALLAQVCSGHAYRYLTNAAAGSLALLTTPLAGVLDWAVFGTIPTVMDAAGAALVAVGCIVILYGHPRPPAGVGGKEVGRCGA